jgi:hypothetical protein
MRAGLVMRKVFVGLRCVFCTAPDVVVMKRHILMIELRTGLRMMMLSAGVLAVLLVLACAGTAAGAEWDMYPGVGTPIQDAIDGAGGCDLCA